MSFYFLLVAILSFTNFRVTILCETIAIQVQISKTERDFGIWKYLGFDISSNLNYEILSKFFVFHIKEKSRIFISLRSPVQKY